MNWRKYSSPSGNCIEVTAQGEAILIRESEFPGIVLTTSRANLATFFQGVKAGVFDDLLVDEPATA